MRWPALALAPVASAYGYMSGRRMDRAPRYRSQLPVICVGNLTAGGTGKTPFVQLVVRRLEALGASPAILTRGHGGSERGPILVDAGRDAADRVGDEALLHAAIAPTVVARDRVAGARLIEQITGVTHIVLDDGLQNPHLAKSLRFVLVDGRRGLGNGQVIPAGPLRAPLAVQRRAIDVLVVNEGFAPVGGTASAEIDELLTGTGRAPLRVRLEPSTDVTWLHGASVVAFAGIGVPENFFRLLQALGAQVQASHAFKDHEPMSAPQAAMLLADADRLRARLVTTAKDRVRLTGTRAPALRELADRATVIDVRLTASAADLAMLDATLTAVGTR